MTPPHTQTMDTGRHGGDCPILTLPHRHTSRPRYPNHSLYPLASPHMVVREPEPESESGLKPPPIRTISHALNHHEKNNYPRQPSRPRRHPYRPSLLAALHAKRPVPLRRLQYGHLLRIVSPPDFTTNHSDPSIHLAENHPNIFSSGVDTVPQPVLDSYQQQGYRIPAPTTRSIPWTGPTITT